MYGLIQSPNAFVSEKQMAVLIDKHIDDHDWSSVLLLLPDITCSREGVGFVAARYYERLTARGCFVKIMSATGLFQTMSEEELNEMFGVVIPKDAYLDNCFGKSIEVVGDIPIELIYGRTRGVCKDTVTVAVSRELLSGKYDAIISIGQVNLDEFTGVEGYAKTLLLGGGGEWIMIGNFSSTCCEQHSNKSHGALPLSRFVKHLQENILDKLPITFVLTGMQQQNNQEICKGIFVGQSWDTFEAAAALSRHIPRLNADESGKSD